MIFFPLLPRRCWRRHESTAELHEEAYVCMNPGKEKPSERLVLRLVQGRKVYKGVLERDLLLCVASIHVLLL